MKKLRLLLMMAACVALSAGFAACDDDGGDGGKNSYTYDGAKYDIKTVGLGNDGVVYHIILSRTNVTDNFVDEPDAYIILSIHEDDLGATTDVSDLRGFVFVDYDLEVGYVIGKISSGTVKVTVSGSNVTVQFNVKFDDGETLKGSYSGGTVEWEAGVA